MLVQHDVNVVIDDGVLTSNGSIVSYEAAITLLAMLTSDELAAEVANDLQFKRVANAVLPARLHWKLASVTAAAAFVFGAFVAGLTFRSEEHTSELQSLMRISYAVFRL